MCGKPTSGENICGKCLAKIDYLEYPLIEHTGNNFFYAITNYDGMSGEIVRKLKFYGKKPLASDIAVIFASFIQSTGLKPDFVGFVPMTLAEKKRRGFNQSELIARNLVSLTGSRLFSGIVKIKETEKQVGLSRRQRISNVKNVFAVKKRPEGNLVIVDDVYTTGATARSVVKAFGRNRDFDIYFTAFSRKI